LIAPKNPRDKINNACGNIEKIPSMSDRFPEIIWASTKKGLANSSIAQREEVAEADIPETNATVTTMARKGAYETTFPTPR
jgi:hypothetical protein